jgi:hypothetical protein
VPEGLRRLAARIEGGHYGDAHNLVWVIDHGDSIISAGLLGASAEPGPTGYYLLGRGMRHLEGL